MTSFRFVSGISTILPLAMIVDSLLQPARYAYGPGSVGELLYLTLGVPILIFNMWAWLDPEIIELYFFGKVWV